MPLKMSRMKTICDKKARMYYNKMTSVNMTAIWVTKL